MSKYTMKDLAERILPTLSCAALLVAAPAAEAQQSTAAASQDGLEEVVVYGKKFVLGAANAGLKSDIPLIETPQSISVISRDLLDSWNTRKLTEALRYTPGVNAEPFGLEPRFTPLRLRGFSANSEGLFRDALILHNPFFLVSYNLEPYGAERLEVPRGPASVLYGQGSPGGLVNYVTKMPMPGAFGEIGVVTGNHNRYEGQVDYNTPLNQSGTVTVRLTGLLRDSDTQVDFIPEEREYLAGALRWDISDATALTVYGNYQQDNAMNSQALPADGTLRPNPNGVVPISLFTGEPTLDDVDRTENAFGYQFSHQFNESIRFFQNFRRNEVDLDDIVVFSNGFLPDMRTITRGSFANFGHLRAITIDNQLHINATTGAVRHQILGGVDYLDTKGEQSQQFGTAPTLDAFNPVYNVPIVLPAPFAVNDLDVEALGFYLQDQIKFGDHWIISAALRHSRAKSETFSVLSNQITQNRDDKELTYRAGLVYLMDSGFAPYVSYAESFLPSTGVDSAGNPFKPETGKQVEAGIKYEPKSFSGIFTLALFDLQREDIVQRNPSFVFFQTGQASSRGVELEAYASMDNGLSFIANYNYLETEVEDHPNPVFEGLAFTQTPKQKASAWVDYNFPGRFSGLGIGLGVRYQSETFSNEINTIESPSFTLVDAAIHYQWERLRFALNVQNLADKEYTSSCFVRNSLLCTFGETRAIRGSVTYRWSDR